MPETKNPIWYIPGPFYRYNEDIKALARRAGVRVVDAHAAPDARDSAPLDTYPQLSMREGCELDVNDRSTMDRLFPAERPLAQDEPAIDEATAEALRLAQQMSAPAAGGKSNKK